MFVLIGRQYKTQILGKNIVAPNVEPNMRHPHSANQKKLSAAANKEACHFQVSEAKLRMQDLAGKEPLTLELIC